MTKRPAVLALSGAMTIVPGSAKEVHMRTFVVDGVVRADHTLIVQVPADIPPGRHEVVIVFSDNDAVARQDQFTANWPVHPVGLVDPTMTFRREDLYADDGR